MLFWSAASMDNCDVRAGWFSGYKTVCYGHNVMIGACLKLTGGGMIAMLQRATVKLER
jgi:hypothetical protein